MQIRFHFTLSGFTLLTDALVHLKIHEQPYSEIDLQPSNEPAIQKHLRHQPFGLASPDKKQIGDTILRKVAGRIRNEKQGIEAFQINKRGSH